MNGVLQLLLGVLGSCSMNVFFIMFWAFLPLYWGIFIVIWCASSFDLRFSLLALRFPYCQDVFGCVVMDWALGTMLGVFFFLLNVGIFATAWGIY
jgi:hypothetical protein